MSGNIYTQGDYAEKHPGWHSEDAPWKASQIRWMIERNRLTPKTISEIGCGAGEILIQLQNSMDEDCRFFGYEISPQAYELCRPKTSERLHFELKDISQENVHFDLLLIIDVIEHVEDYFSFLRDLKQKSEYKIFHIPLDLSVQTVLRSRPILFVRQIVGHIHYFTKETALQSLKDTGYEIIDYFYTPSAIELDPRSRKMSLARLPRKLMYRLNRDLAVRIMGGYSLMVLSK